MAQYTLEDIVKEYIIEIGESNFNKFARFYQYAVSIFREIHYDVSAIPKSTVINTSDNGSANLPDDYVNYIRIGVIDSNNLFRDLGFSNDIAPKLVFDSCGNPASAESSGTPPNNIADGLLASPEGVSSNYRNGEIVGGFFGVGGGNNNLGYYKIDAVNRVISFNKLSQAQVVLEYLADISVSDGDYIVHPFIIETIKQGIAWKAAERNPRSNLGQIQLANKAYNNAHRQSIRRYKNITISEWAQALRKGNKAAPKF